MMEIRGSVAVTGLVMLVFAGRAAGQGDGEGHWAPTDPGRAVPGCCAASGPPVLQAIRVSGHEIRVDGRAVEAPWQRAPVATDFVQFEPGEGESATERTEARVLYGDDALYVAIRAYDRDPAGIVGQLTRRDQDSYSDQVAVIIDSYFDRRTAFHFAVNPVGVKQDIYRFDDTGEDAGWDAVWDVATTRDEQGWTAEFRIPYSQLRFRDAQVQTWGINFARTIARRDETDVWAPTTRRDAAVVSRFGELRGLQDLNAPRRLEIVPYTVARLERADGEAANPFYHKNQTFGTVGADLKYGVTSDLTLDVTMNPDFGQVEADPAQVNLTAFETFYPERRPFFLEGASIFNFSLRPGRRRQRQRVALLLPSDRARAPGRSGRPGRIRGRGPADDDPGRRQALREDGQRVVHRRAARGDRGGAGAHRAGGRPADRRGGGALHQLRAGPPPAGLPRRAARPWASSAPR